MIEAGQVAAVLITRGNVDLDEILDSWPEFGKRFVVSGAPNVYARWEAVWKAGTNVVYVQDDDCIVPVDKLLEAWEADDTLLVNVPEGENMMVGWGALVKRGYAHRNFQRYLDRFGMDKICRTFADFVVTSLTPCRAVDLGHQDLPWATAPDRLYQQPGHYRDQDVIRERCRLLGPR